VSKYAINDRNTGNQSVRQRTVLSPIRNFRPWNAFSQKCSRGQAGIHIQVVDAGIETRDVDLPRCGTVSR